MSKKEYLNFKNMKDAKPFFEKNALYFKDFDIETYWKRYEWGFYLSYIKTKHGNISLIRCSSIWYLYEDDSIHLIRVKRGTRSFENKLYHLTHGPKAISIPDAFKILSL